jgi:hypothetical protein
MPRFSTLALVVALAAPACGSARAHRAAAPEAAERDLLGEPRDLPPVPAGAYRLSMSAKCDHRERTLSGMLTLKRISGSDVALGSASSEPSDSLGEGALLWGQTDLDFEQLRGCLATPEPGAEEPIHPSVLVEVLKWDGEPHHQVLLVSTDAHQGSGAQLGSGGGIAMWVEEVDQGHLAGVWSRWELVGQEEGRWHADVVEPTSNGP